MTIARQRCMSVVPARIGPAVVRASGAALGSTMTGATEAATAVGAGAGGGGGGWKLLATSSSFGERSGAGTDCKAVAGALGASAEGGGGALAGAATSDR